MNRTLYFVHRWLGLFVSAQLLAWSVGGLMFSLLDIDDVHGDLDRTTKTAAPLPRDAIPVERALAVAEAATKATLVERRGRVVWQLDVPRGAPVLVDARDGSMLPPVDAEEAKRLALTDVTGARGAVDATLFEKDAPIEYREKPMPAWRVVIDHDKEIHIYVHATTGEITARRNAKWRLFDFFWMLHVMDYSGREDFQHPLLTGFAVLAVLASTSGLVLWGTRLKRRLKRDAPGASPV
jgi:hypothetical protein